SNMDTIKEKLDKLKADVVAATAEISKNLTNYEAQIDKIELPTANIEKIEPLDPELDRDKLISGVKLINRVLRNIGINPEKLFEKQDLFDLWDNYLKGQQTAFTDALSRMTHKQTTAIRKAFDDNADFHNQVIRYLFLMDIVMKDMSSSSGTNRDELVNFSVNQSLDKVYFILVKALNSAE
ncbi:MAG: hypothetical protein J6W96_00085, partial [Alphaproteobacteria bacterium]|nr:hypothetical protein [Alphaproteobacteria bacterium]